jgi:hypothetical protein
MPPASDQPPPNHDPGRQRDHDVEYDREQHRVVRDRDVAEPEQKEHDRREREQHDEVVEGHLHQGVGGVAPCQVAPDEHHSRAGRRAEENGARNVLARQPCIDEGREENLQEEPGEEEHRERLDQPVRHQRDGDPPRLLPDIEQASEVDLHHHREDHGPDQDRHGQIHLRDREA